ncbi:MAG: ABC transporter substrate-binding protein [Burkholderiales bacterium]
MFIRFAALLIAASFLSGTALAQERIRFSLDWRIEGPVAIFFNAEQKGYFKQEGLDVSLDVGTGSAAAVARVATGAYDMSFGDMSALIEYFANTPNPSRMQAVYMVHEQAPGAIFTLKKSGIRKASDLAGKKLGGPSFDAVRKMLPLIARANGFDPKSVSLVTMEPALRETMLVKGDVDAITGFYYTQLLTLNARGVKTEDMQWFKYADMGINNLYGNAIIASERMIAERPRAIAGFVRALNRSLKEVMVDPASAMAALKRREALIDEKLELERLKLFLEFVATPVAKADGLGVIRKTKLETQVDDVVAAFGLKVKPSPDLLFNSSFLPSSAERRF